MAEKLLSHHSHIWITTWGSNRIFSIRTAEGFARQYGKDPEVEVNDNRRARRPLVDALQESVEGYGAALFIQENSVIEIGEGEIVSVERRLYKIRLDDVVGEPKFDPA
jgi:hypothetical protein